MLCCNAVENPFILEFPLIRRRMKARGHTEEETVMDYVNFFTSLNPFILGILMLVLLLGAYNKWVSH